MFFVCESVFMCESAIIQLLQKSLCVKQYILLVMQRSICMVNIAIALHQKMSGMLILRTNISVIISVIKIPSYRSKSMGKNDASVVNTVLRQSVAYECCIW